jgi:hypothetical protein
VPQGAIPNPMLFLLYMNYLPINIQGPKTDLLADNVNILIKAENIYILNLKINRILKELINLVSCSLFSDKY